MLVLAQTRALGGMLWRFWLRRGVVGRRGGGSMRAPGVAARGLLVLLFGSIGYAEGGLSHGNSRAIALFALGLFGYAWAVMASTAIVAVRGIIAPLDARFLDELPLREGPRVVARVLGQPQLFALAVAGVYTAAPERSLLRAGVFGSLVVFAAMVTGLASAHVVRVFLSPMRIARMTVPLLVTGISAFLLIAEAPFLAQAAWAARVADAAWPLARGLVTGGWGAGEIAGLSLVVVASGLSIGWAERAGFDRVDAVPTKRYKRAAARDLTLGRVDRVLAAREPGARFVWVGALYVAVCVAGVYGARLAGVQDAGARSRRPLDHRVPRVLGGLIAGGPDGGARPRRARPPRAAPDRPGRSARGQALAPDPAPGDDGGGAAFLFLPFAGAPAGERIDVGWHVAAVIASVWIAAGALASVAFLTSGAGGGPRAAMNAPLNLERLLVLVPMLAVAYAPDLRDRRDAAHRPRPPRLRGAARGARIRPLARRPGGLQPRDVGLARAPGPERVRRAHQLFDAHPLRLPPRSGHDHVPRLLDLRRGAGGPDGAGARRTDGDPPLARGAALRGPRRDVRVRDRRVRVLVYAHVIARLGFMPPAMTEARASPIAAAAFVFAAPIAEELFFRGWLLDAIGREYAARGGSFAIVMTSSAFASISPPVNLVPALVFGLAAGSLARKSRAIGPGIVAHAIVNAMTLFVVG